MTMIDNLNYAFLESVRQHEDLTVEKVKIFTNEQLDNLWFKYSMFLSDNEGRILCAEMSSRNMAMTELVVIKQGGFYG